MYIPLGLDSLTTASCCYQLAPRSPPLIEGRVPCTHGGGRFGFHVVDPLAAGPPHGLLCARGGGPWWWGAPCCVTRIPGPVMWRRALLPFKMKHFELQGPPSPSHVLRSDRTLLRMRISVWRGERDVPGEGSATLDQTGHTWAKAPLPEIGAG